MYHFIFKSYRFHHLEVPAPLEKALKLSVQFFCCQSFLIKPLVATWSFCKKTYQFYKTSRLLNDNCNWICYLHERLDFSNLGERRIVGFIIHLIALMNDFFVLTWKDKRVMRVAKYKPVYVIPNKGCYIVSCLVADE